MLSLSESLYHTHLRLWSLNLKSSWFTGLQAISMKLTSQAPTCPNRHPPPVIFDFLNAIIFFSTQLFTSMGITWTLSLPDNVHLLKSSISFTFLTTTFHLFHCLGSYLLLYPAHWLYKPELYYHQPFRCLPSFIFLWACIPWITQYTSWASLLPYSCCMIILVSIS